MTNYLLNRRQEALIASRKAFDQLKKRVVIINGSAGVGKDSFVESTGKIVKITNYSSVEDVKMAGSLLGWEGGKEEEDRQFLSDLKDLSAKYYDDPFKKICSRINGYLKYDSAIDVLYLHIREPKEIARVKRAYETRHPIITLLITNPNVKYVTSNHADRNVYNYTYDYTIINDGSFDDLDKKAYEFVKSIFGHVYITVNRYNDINKNCICWEKKKEDRAPYEVKIDDRF